jgi:hypothetical protein
MQKQQISYLVLLVFGISFFIGSCTKTGPAGPPGAAGSTGPAGPPGSQGPQGNANVFTDTFSLVSADWVWNSLYTYSTPGGGYTAYFTRYHDVSFSKLTQGILDSGQIMVFMTPNQLDTNQWAPLPYTFLAFGSQYYYNYVFETMPGKVRLHYFYTANGPSGVVSNTLSTDEIPFHKFKIVITGGTVSTDMIRNHVDPGNYAQVMAYLNL